MKQLITKRASDVPPALSSGEWAKLERQSPSQNAFAVQEPAGLVRLRVSAPDQQIDIRGASEYAAVIALANFALPDDDARKLARAHVKLLRRVADDNELIPWGAEKTAIAELRRLADALESYLPAVKTGK